MPPPPKERPRGGLMTKKLKKTPLPRCASDRPEAGVHPILAIFMITVRTLQIHVRFSKAKNAIIFKNR